MGSGYYWEGAGKPVGWSKVQESVTFPTSECCSCLNAELTYTNWVKGQGRVGKRTNADTGRELEQYRGFLLPLGEGVHFQTSQNKTKKEKKKQKTENKNKPKTPQIPCQTKRTIV